ncbi:hypothetical protein L202_08231 [Cryptococcus amylolentus CBS 6039]|uniref:SUI1 domain-containing protein n=2 Tax=Cryptococcus amylolentus TaxID=104669 RepID=A0A1E3H9I5_9TREE|nr:hypothetical protein L202_08231 [Cryptococcus amylolentus CBS 6039]ODN72795.1 hypothetical protein L202_08231 [Cryptococcus amylolentus CBS 6039]ODN97994.1 hypothetical protein I350_07633 [Cryptococcus amylolentus CBS 6273]
MFKKPLVHQSNATPIRSSARRQLLAAIFEQFPLLVASIDDNDKKELGNLILPEGVKTGTFKNSTGVEGTFWIAPDGNPLWMSFGRNSKEYIPTLYLLTLPLPRPILPVIQIYHPMPPPILTGAPLFIPAVRNIDKPHLLPDVQKDHLVAFATSPSRNDDVHYVGVGRIAADGGMRGAWERRIQLLQGGEEKEEGKFADVLCIIEDHLWELGSKSTPPTFTFPAPKVPLASAPGGKAKDDLPPIENLSVSGDATGESSEPTICSAPLTPDEISSLLSLSLLQALSSLQPSSFPMPASLLYSSHILPSRPSYIPKDKRDEVVIAKSEWKKLAKWMKEINKEGIVKIKESKGEVTVVSFDPKHPDLQAYEGYTTIAQEEAKAVKKAAREAAANPEGADGKPAQSASQPIDIQELWKPISPALLFWEACGLSKSEYYPPSALRQTLDEYIIKHNLIVPNNHRFVLLDEELGKAVGVKKPEPGQSMARDDVIAKLRNGVSWAVSIGGTIKKGALQPITLTIKSRGGRRTVTHITGLELFSIPAESFAEEMRKKCAGSASVQPREGVSPKLGLVEVQVQGSQQKIIIESLVGRGVPKRWIKDEGKK